MRRGEKGRRKPRNEPPGMTADSLVYLEVYARMVLADTGYAIKGIMR